MWQKIKNFRRNAPFLFIIVLVVIIVVAAYGSLEVMHLTSSSEFCKYCHTSEKSGVRGEYYTWKESVHSSTEAGCIDCHGKPGVAGYFNAHVVAGMKSLYNELFVPEAKIREIMTKTSTDPVAAEHASPDVTCLFCHSDFTNTTERNKTFFSIGIKWRPLDTVVNPEYRERYGLSDIAVSPVTKGVEPNHAKHMSAGLLCTNCHLGVAHGGKVHNLPKMETCFACHDSKRETVETVPANDDCAKCHSMQKAIQEGTYVKDVEETRWYMADLECSSCHDDAFSKPTTEKCVSCHDDSYASLMTDGQKAYDDKLAAIDDKFKKLFKERNDMPMGKRALFNEYYRIVRIVEMDGSKSIHNPDYIDSLFAKIDELAESIDNWTAPAEK